MGRVLTFILVFGLLSGATWFCWQRGHEICPGLEPKTFASGTEVPIKAVRAAELVAWDAAAGRMLIGAGGAGAAPTAELALDNWLGARGAHVVIAARGDGLVPGEMDWEKGRAMVMWRQQDGRYAKEHAGLLAAQYNERTISELMVPLDRKGTPVMVAQNLGTAGTFVIDHLTITPTRPKAWAPAARYTLVAVWLAWAVAGMRVWICRRVAWWRAAAAGLCLTAALYYFVLPGPWMPYRPILEPFEIAGVTRGAPAEATRMASGTDAAVAPAPGDAPGKPARGALVRAPELAGGEVAEVPGKMESSLGSKVFYAIKDHARWFLHMTAFAAMAAGMILLCGTPRGAYPVLAIAMASEAMQTLFGFGFDPEDIQDLVLDGLGIVLGILLARRATKWLRARGAGSNSVESVEMSNP